MRAAADSDEPDEADEARLWRAYKHGGSRAARERLFAWHASFARNIAYRHYRERSRGDIEIADLQQLAYVGLLEAVDRYDSERGIPFRAYAAHRISGSISDGIARLSEVHEQITWRRRVNRERLQSLSDSGDNGLTTADAMEKLAQVAVGLALGFILEGTGLFAQESDEGPVPLPSATAYDSLAWKEVVAQVHAELSALPEREQTILRQHYMNGVDFDQIASLLSLSKGRISQMHRAALALVRKRMSARGHFRLGG
ncbi:MAG: sigma-70 family RNA polymerase sigma factor [Rhizomicrobium sp.]